MCISPITLKRDYRTIDGEFTKVVPCGKCMKCLGRRRMSWQFRLEREMRQSKSASFFTLTYEVPPVSFNGNMTLVKDDFQRFMKRFRISDYNKNRKIKYYAVGEYGEQFYRPHYHIVSFNHSLAFSRSPELLSTLWNRGKCHVGSVNASSINYVVSYVMKGRWQPMDELDDRLPEFSLMSKNIGLNHLTPQMVRYYKDNMVDFVTLDGGALQPLPRYYKDRVFSKEDRKFFHELNQERRERSYQKYDDAWHEVMCKNDLIRRHEKMLKYKTSVH